MADAQDFIGIHCGSDEAYVSPCGEIYFADTPYSSTDGYGYIGGVAPDDNTYELIGGGEDMERLYRLARRDNFSYQIDLPTGLYAVKLMLADIVNHGPGFLSMSIRIEDEFVIQNLDLCEKAGRSYAWPIRALADINDGQLDIDFGAEIGDALCSAIAVHAVEEDSIPPPALSGFETIGGFSMNILFWDYSLENDLAGYRVYRRSLDKCWEQVTEDFYPLYRYLDYDVAYGSKYEYRVTAVDFWGNESEPTEILSAIPVSNCCTELARIQIVISPENLYELNARWWDNDYVDAELKFGRGEFLDGFIRYRGGFTRYMPKKNYKLKLPDGEQFDGRDRFCLASEMSDRSMLRSRVARLIFDRLTEMNPASRNVHLEINGKFKGVYLETEDVGNTYLEARGLSTAGNLYQGESGLYVLPSYEEYMLNYPKENNSDSDWSDIIEFIDWIDAATPMEFKQEAGDYFNVDQLLDMYTGIIAMSEIDFGGHNYFLYNNPADGQWYFIPWDNNATFYDPDSPINLYAEGVPSPIDGNRHRLVERVLAEPLFQYAYCKKLERFLADDFSIEAATALIQEVHEEIFYEAQRDVYKDGFERYDVLFQGLDNLNNFVNTRVPFLQGEIQGFIEDPGRGPEFRLNEAMLVNVSTLADESGDFDPWIEIMNISPVELDLSGFTLHFGENSWSLTDDIVVPAEGFTLLWLDGEAEEGANHAAFRASSEGGILWLTGNHGTLSDSVVVPALNADRSWSRMTDASGEWIDCAEPTPGSSNAPPADPAVLVINELQAVNSSTIGDNCGDYDDWIEIYNPASYAVELTGLYLSDDFERPLKWIFPDTILGAQRYLLVWCDEEPEEGSFHSAFKLSGDGEQVILTNRDAAIIIDQVVFGPQESNHSYG
ncbi:CotH kinase family protein, partial [bacterium]|nr:CotH kinase family protein [bacterium]